MIVRASIVLLALFHFNVALAQSPSAQYGIVRVKVFDADNNQPIPFAVVYFNKTTIGGYTDNNGFVEIKKIPYGAYDLIASEVSHKPYQRKVIVKSEQPLYITVQLPGRTLEAVQVKAKRDDKWNRQYSRFQKLFFGADHYKQCKISNPWILDFKNPQGDFVAEAKQPLKIENKFLGYNLEFDLKMCTFSAVYFVINGDIRFEEMEGSDSLKAVWKKNRENAYRGSPQHFLRAMVDSTLIKEGYNIYNDLTADGNIVRLPSFLNNLQRNIMATTTTGKVKPAPNGMFTVELPYRLEVHYLRRRQISEVYRNVSHPVSWLEVKGDHKLIVNSDGVVQNPQALTMLGSMSELKVADLLPLNYQPTDIQADEVSTAPVYANASLLEKPYIQTDRNYYYGGETMWLKGYMNYLDPIMKDTLSQSIYLELAEGNGNIVVKKHYKLEDGMFDGDIVFRKELKPGLYQLRAYTAWMLNLNPNLIFTKSINLLDDHEAARMIADYKPSADTLPYISLLTDKNSYSARDKITVTIDVTDSSDFRTVSNLSIAVTDIVQAVPVEDEKTILTNYAFDKTQSSDTSRLVAYNIEYGLDFSGQFQIKKKPMQASITVFQENTTQTMGIITDEEGKFGRSLEFNDTVTFYLRSMSANNKKGIVVMNESRLRSPVLPIESSPLDLYSSDNVQHARPTLGDTKVLQEVTVKATKLEKPQPAVIHGKGDYTVTGDWINERNYTDVFLAIVAKVPGITYDPNTPSITFRTSQFGSMTPTQPLLLVDNVTITDPAQIRDVPIRGIERIDIIKFGGASIYGARGAGGVIAIFTKKGNGPAEQPTGFDKSKLQEVKRVGYSTPAKFTAPDYSNPAADDRIDYRSTIYWSPYVITDGNQPATVTFYAADVAAKYRIIVEGVTKAGTPVRAEKIIEVTKGH
ncbi:MAG: carboxypeptidase-like regulatory domain-containing protein [Bacteroidota bacterium]